MDKSIYRYILRHTKRDQILLVVLTAASMPLVYYSLEIPKLIINKAIGGGAAAFQIFGFALTQIEYLLFLSGLFLAMVIINGGMKYVINVYRGVLGERMLRRFRYTLYARILRFPLPHFKNLSAGEIIPMVTAETEPLGGFIGDSIALPVMQGGLLLTYLSFIFAQDFWLGLAAIALYPPQVYLIPRLQHAVNLLSKERVHTVRKLSDRIGESVAGISDIHANDTGSYERADISQRLGIVFHIRNEIFRRKFFIKFLNNFLAQLTPFFFYAIGGYLVLQNQLSLGALVAVLAAYKDISPPWKELLKFYQITEDVRVKYAQIIEQFAPPGMLAPALQQPADDSTAPKLDGGIRVTRLSYSEDAAAQVDGMDFELGGTAHTAIFSKDGGGGGELMQLLARLLAPSAGAIHFGEADLQTLPEAVTGRRIGYCGDDSRLFNASIRDNLYYGLKQRPGGGNGEDADDAAHRMTIKESLASGNSTQNRGADWVDIGLAGAADAEEFERAVYAAIECAELGDELLTLALRAPDIAPPPQLAEQITAQRDRVIAQVNQLGSGGIIEPLDAAKYIHNLSVEENLLFGAPASGLSASEFLAANPAAQKILHDSGLQRDLGDIGLELARLMVELFSDVPDDSELFEQFSFIKAADLPEYRQLLAETDAGGEIAGTARAKLLALSLQLCPARHRLDLITPKLQKKVLGARKTLMQEFGADNPHLRFFERRSYHPGMSLQENLLFGKIAYSKGHLQPQVTETIRGILADAGLNREIVLAGLDCPAGAAGLKLPPVIRQKITLARALLKNPEVLIVNNALGDLDARSFARILGRVVETRRGRNLIWALNDPACLAQFERVLLIEKNKLFAHDTPQALAEVIAAI
ncbi:MAG: ABC transporter transmembrane domain-containing protein [Gammaproteobacteria bacterium]